VLRSSQNLDAEGAQMLSDYERAAHAFRLNHGGPPAPADLTADVANSLTPLLSAVYTREIILLPEKSPAQSMVHGECDVRPRATFPFARHHHSPLVPIALLGHNRSVFI